jgi:hypothetical protein
MARPFLAEVLLLLLQLLILPPLPILQLALRRGLQDDTALYNLLLAASGSSDSTANADTARYVSDDVSDDDEPTATRNSAIATSKTSNTSAVAAAADAVQSNNSSGVSGEPTRLNA